MVMSVNTNVLSLTAQRNMMDTQSALSNSIQRLSTGLRINSAKDDAAGLAIAERFTSSIRGLSIGQRNANDGISFAQTAEGALEVIGNNLQRIRELAVQSLNDSNTAADRAALDQEVKQLTAEVKRIEKNTTFNGRKILDGTLQSLSFQIGAERGQTLAMSGMEARVSRFSVDQLVVTGGQLSGVDYNSLGNITINGGTEVDLSSATDRTGVIDAINSAYPNATVQAQAASGPTTANLGEFAAAATPGILRINEVDIVIAVAVDPATDRTALLNAIGGASGLGDIQASFDADDNFLLTSPSGADIRFLASPNAYFDGRDYSTTTTFSGGIEIFSILDSLTVSGTGAATLGLDGPAATQTFSMDEVSVATAFRRTTPLWQWMALSTWLPQCARI
jgi:flagellin